MKSQISKGVLAAGLAASLAVASSAYAVGSGPNAYGEPAPLNRAEEVVTINPDTKYANVREEDIVKFVDAQTGQSFAWVFNVAAPMNFALSDVAPAGFP